MKTILKKFFFFFKRKKKINPQYFPILNPSFSLSRLTPEGVELLDSIMLQLKPYIDETLQKGVGKEYEIMAAIKCEMSESLYRLSNRDK